MKITKVFVVTLAIGICSCGAFGAILFSDDFESYAQDSLLRGQGRWEAGGTPGYPGPISPTVSTDYGTSGKGAGISLYASSAGSASAYINADHSVIPYGIATFTWDSHLIAAHHVGTYENDYIFFGNSASVWDLYMTFGNTGGGGGTGNGYIGLDAFGQSRSVILPTYPMNYRLTLTADLDAKSLVLSYLDLDTAASGALAPIYYSPNFHPDFIAFYLGGYITSGFDNVVVDGVPEPVTLSLLACGGVLMLLKRRSR